MRAIDLVGVAYIAVWLLGGLVIAREARLYPSNLVKLMAILAIALGPLGMLIYLGFRHLGQSAARGRWLAARRATPLPPEWIEPR